MSYIKIAENARFLVEDNNYTLEWKEKSGMRPDGKKSAKEFKWVLGGYFPDIASMCIDYIKNSPSHLKDGEMPLKTLQEVVNYVQGAEKRITHLIQGK